MNLGRMSMGDAHYSDTEIYGERAFTQADLLADALRMTEVEV